MLKTLILISKLSRLILHKLAENFYQYLHARLHRLTYKSVDSPKNVVVIGASFTGYHVAKLLANSLPTSYRVVVVEKSSHFQFTWVFPRFGVVGGDEHKAFIPYGGYLSGAPDGSYMWLQDAVVEVDERVVTLGGGKKIEYEYLVVATGCQADAPSRTNKEEKADGIDVLRGLQAKIKEANHLIVVGGGPAGVELATDAKGQYPEKTVTLIHSRKTLLHNFGDNLHAAAMKALNELGVRVILGERLVLGSEESGSIALSSGESVSYDLLVCIS